jgi:surface protein
LTHKYAGAKDYKIKIQNITRFANYSANNSSFGKLIAVNDWSNIQWTTTNSMFTYADHLNSIPSSAPNLSKVKSMWAMFQNATIFNQPLSNWDTSGVTLMGNMFGSDFVAAAS